MRPWLLASLLLAGCVAPAQPEPDAERVFALSRPYDLGVCDILEALVEIDAAAARPHVPPGFSLSESDGRTFAILGAAQCARGSRGFLALPVAPEDERLDAPGARHFFEPEHLVLDDAFAAALAEVRANATRVTRIAADAAPPRPAFFVEAGGWTHAGEGAGAALVPPTEEVAGGVFREWFHAEGGYGYLEASYALTGTFGLVPAQLRTGEGTAAREVLGASAVGELYVLAESGYADATLGFVPHP